jgi:hypothetical protein
LVVVDDLLGGEGVPGDFGGGLFGFLCGVVGVGVVWVEAGGVELFLPEHFVGDDCGGVGEGAVEGAVGEYGEVCGGVGAGPLLVGVEVGDGGLVGVVDDLEPAGDGDQVGQGGGVDVGEAVLVERPGYCGDEVGALVCG